jgi:hypothetical protein
VVINESLLSAAQCGTELKKENSLFITDIDVVEDPGRSAFVADTNGFYDPALGMGNKTGEYTLGYLIENFVNQPVTVITPKQFIKNWILSWYNNDNIGPNNYTLMGRNGTKPNGASGVELKESVLFLMEIWLEVASRLDNNTSFSFSYQSWENQFDAISETSLLKAAPFKLTAIVNRIDLRGNFAYNNSINNAGETRLIFTFINPNNGNPIRHQDVGFGGGVPNKTLDWVGCNIILEYSNVQKNMCELQAFAKRWYDLSSLNRNTTTYRDELASIVSTVTNANSMPNNPNGSALARIRTNEKIFGIAPTSISSTGTSFDWETTSWELRQFELSATTHYLENKLMTNTPDKMNSSTVGPEKYNSNLTGYVQDKPFYTDVIEWVYGSNTKKQRVLNGNYNLPQHLLATSSILNKEMAEFYDFGKNGLPSYIIQTGNENIDAPNFEVKNIRHQLSLNTCQGCHGADTKTTFTHIKPLGVGKKNQANYWQIIPGVIDSAIDDRFTTLNPSTVGGNFENENYETTFDVISQTNNLNFDNSKITSNFKNQVLSSFLTGRRYTDDPSEPWQDDELGISEGIVGDPNAILSDEKMNGMFWVYDPSNQSSTCQLPLGKGGIFLKYTLKNGDIMTLNDAKKIYVIC